jgi:ABC-type multidrug transport system ATPase subunit
MPGAIEVAGLYARYEQIDVLEDITLEVHEGEILGLIGLNGAGKTTLLKAILMLIAPVAGSVLLFGQPHDQPSSRARLAYLPEKFQPPSHLCGHDFVRLSLAFYGERVSRAVTCALAEEIDLDPAALRRPIRSYSKGMAQKLGVLATLLTGRPLLILDEPMSGLDPKARVLLKRQLAAARARGRTIFMSSPILADHDGLCDRVAVMHRGRLGYVGSPAGLKESQGAATLETAFLASIEPTRAAVRR